MTCRRISPAAHEAVSAIKAEFRSKGIRLPNVQDDAIAQIVQHHTTALNNAQAEEVEHMVFGEGNRAVAPFTDQTSKGWRKSPKANLDNVDGFPFRGLTEGME